MFRVGVKKPGMVGCPEIKTYFGLRCLKKKRLQCKMFTYTDTESCDIPTPTPTPLLCPCVEANF